MNCPECGHPKEQHIDGCYHRIISEKILGWFYCGCTAVEADTEEQVLEKRLTLARDLIAVLSHNGMMPENLMTDNGAARGLMVTPLLTLKSRRFAKKARRLSVFVR